MISDRIRATLRSKDHQDGLAISVLAQILGAHEKTVRTALSSMPDAYVDRWSEAPTPGSGPSVVQIWCCVEVPENCPRPDPKNPRRKAKKEPS